MPKIPQPRRVALMLELKWPYKRHVGVFAGTQRYAQQQGWDSIIDEYVAENLPAVCTKITRNGNPLPLVAQARIPEQAQPDQEITFPMGSATGEANSCPGASRSSRRAPGII